MGQILNYQTNERAPFVNGIGFQAKETTLGQNPAHNLPDPEISGYDFAMIADFEVFCSTTHFHL